MHGCAAFSPFAGELVVARGRRVDLLLGELVRPFLKLDLLLGR
jgi:hypothetical protein